MKEQTHFHIPTPCHEDWDNMTPRDKGRFCASCSKQVVDFSLMSDQQVLNYFKNATGNVCGRFANDQLQRPMIEAPKQKKKVWWIAAMMPLFLFAKKEDKKNIQGEVVPAILDTTKPIEILKGKIKATIEPVIDTVISTGEATMGLIMPDFVEDSSENSIDTAYAINTTIGDVELDSACIAVDDTSMLTNANTIHGLILDEEGNTIPYTTIKMTNSFENTRSDSLGNFLLNIKHLRDKISIEVSSIGYKTDTIEVENFSQTQNIVLKNTDAKLPDVMVCTGPYFKGRTVGETIVVRKVTYTDILDTTWKKAFRNETFKIFPNPVNKNSAVKLEINKIGNFSLQLLDNHSKLLLLKNIQIESEKSITEITLPSSLSSGLYYIRLIDKDKKKQYTDKLIVQ